MSIPYVLAPFGNDTFTRANENPLNPTNWVRFSFFSHSLEILSNQCVGVDTTGCHELFTASTPPNDQYAQATFAAFAGNSFLRLYCRGNTSGNGGNGYEVVSESSKFLAINSLVSIAPTQLGSASCTRNIGDVFVFTAVGTTLTAFQNGNQILAVTDSTYTSGLTGLGMQAASTVGDTAFTNFVMGWASSAPAPVSVPASEVGNPIQFFGVSPANPSVIQTAGNTLQLFSAAFQPTPHGVLPFTFRYADDAGFLGRTAMPGQLLVLPGTGWFRGTSYVVCAHGSITIPSSAQNAGIAFTLFSNYFKSTSPIQIQSDAIAALPNSPLVANPIAYPWSMVASINGSPAQATPPLLACTAVFNVNGTIVNVSGQSSADLETTGPHVQLSLGAQFAGTVSGQDMFQATLDQFEIQEVSR